jgi:predicted GIY-YIG superfamily endonuclease
MNPTCYVYIIGTTTGAYKVGVTKNPEKRHRSLKSGIPDPSSILHTIPCLSRDHAFHVEKSLHNQLHEYHTSGEWFRPPRYIIDSIIMETRTPTVEQVKPIKRVAQIQKIPQIKQPKITQPKTDRLITSGKFAGWPLLNMTHPLKEEVLEIIHSVSNHSRRRPPLKQILERASWRGMSPEQVYPILSELKAERVIIEQCPGIFRFP